MAVTITVCNQTDMLIRYGAMQYSLFISSPPRNPFFVALRSSAVTTNNGGNPYLRNADGTYNGNGTNQLSTGNGYTYGGKSLENVGLTYSSGVVTMKADNVKWIATGAGFSARSAILCYELPVSSYFSGDRLGASVALAAIDFGGLETADNNRSFTVKWPAGGILQWTMA
jgi:hypothetical protein